MLANHAARLRIGLLFTVIVQLAIFSRPNFMTDEVRARIFARGAGLFGVQEEYHAIFQMATTYILHFDSGAQYLRCSDIRECC
jgi:hypothetical protein